MKNEAKISKEERELFRKLKQAALSYEDGLIVVSIASARRPLSSKQVRFLKIILDRSAKMPKKITADQAIREMAEGRKRWLRKHQRSIPSLPSESYSIPKEKKEVKGLSLKEARLLLRRIGEEIPIEIESWSESERTEYVYEKATDNNKLDECLSELKVFRKKLTQST